MAAVSAGDGGDLIADAAHLAGLERGLVPAKPKRSCSTSAAVSTRAAGQRRRARRGVDADETRVRVPRSQESCRGEARQE